MEAHADDMTSEELGFVVACIEGVAARLRQNPRRVYDALAVESDLLTTYIVPCYAALHTQGMDYIADEICTQMRRRSVLT